jgi:hypothetical protein
MAGGLWGNYLPTQAFMRAVAFISILSPEEPSAKKERENGLS